jgi:multiple sugar transport system substrate-binding protein
MQRKLSGYFGLCMALLLLCGRATADITILGWPGGPEEKALNALVDKYNATQGKSDRNRARTTYFSREGFYDQLSKELSSGSKAFDINLLATYNVGRYARYVDPLPAEVLENMKKTFPEAVLKTQQYEGRQYGVPTDLGLHFVYFRQDLMRRLLSDSTWKHTYSRIAQQHLGRALQAKDPQQWDWDDFKATALFFTRSINPQSPVAYGTALQMKNLLFNVMVWQNTAHSFGGDWRDGNKITVNSEPFVKGLEVYKFILDKAPTPPDSDTFEYAQTNAAFGSGTVAFILQWNAAYDELNNPSKNAQVAGKFDVAPPPKGSKSRGTHVHTLGLGINKASGNKVDAVKFLKWLSTPETMRYYIQSGGLTPMKTEHMRGIARPEIQKLAEYAGWYGFVMQGATSANALKIYELQADEFTAFWAGKKSSSDALKAVEVRMADWLKP